MGIWGSGDHPQEQRKSKKQSNKLAYFSFPSVSPQISEEGNKKEDKTELVSKDLVVLEKDPAEVFSARAFPPNSDSDRLRLCIRADLG